MKAHENTEHPSLEQIIRADAWARAAAQEEVARRTIVCP
jgi:hypothetical protein